MSHKELIAKILEYMSLGYSVKETVDAFPEEKQLDEDKLFNLVKCTFNSAYKKLPEEAKKDLDAIRKERKNEINIAARRKIAEEVISRVKENPGFKRNAMMESIRFVAKNTGKTVSYVTVSLKMIFPDYYNYCINALDVDDEYLLSAALNIIDKEMHYSLASITPYYDRMMQYLENNRPDLLRKINDIYQSHTKTQFILDNPLKIFKEKWEKYLYEIILEFRITIEELVLFINQNSGLFLIVDNKFITEDELVKGLASVNFTSYRNGLKFYLYESDRDQFSDFRTKRFQSFLEKFNALKSSEDYLEEYLKTLSASHLSRVIEKNKHHFSNEQYAYSIEDVRAILKYGCKYALTKKDLADSIGMLKLDREYLCKVLSDSSLLEDQMIIESTKKLSDFNFDYGYRFQYGKNDRYRS